MTVTLAGSDPRQLYTHFLLYGLAAICEDADVDDLRLSWTPGMTPRPRLAGTGLTPESLGGLVAAHARDHTDDTWLQQGLPGEPARGLFSPRLKPPTSSQGWLTLQSHRQHGLDWLTAQPATLDLRMLGALGEPAYWRRSPKGAAVPGDGASRLDMQPRNHGSEFVGTRLRPLAAAVAARTADQVASGLLGETLVDDLGGSANAESRGSANLRTLGPADSAQTWAALWGISQAPVAHQVHRQSNTAIHIRRGGTTPRAGTFAAPVWAGAWRPARLRAVLRSGQLTATGAALTDDDPPPLVSHAWLTSRGVLAVWTFPVGTFGSASAPERRALDGHLHRLPPV